MLYQLSYTPKAALGLRTRRGGVKRIGMPQPRRNTVA